MEKKRLTNIIDMRYVKKVGKYVVELGIHNEPKKTVWLSEKQAINLNNCFDETKNGYSNKDVSVYGHWNERGYYAYTSVVHHKQQKIFKEPFQHDLSDLKDVN